jgi:hypothetical protein
MKNLKIKIIVGFRRDQSYTIDAEEAHKAYYLFLNPEKRGVFNNGVALIGNDIKFIKPDYNATMGWNPTHILESSDWSEIRAIGLDKKFSHVLSSAKEIAKTKPEMIGRPLSEIIALPEPGGVKIHTKGPTQIGELIK